MPKVYSYKAAAHSHGLCGSRFLAEQPSKSVAGVDVLDLALIKIVEKLPGLPGVSAKALKVGDPVLLIRNVPLTSSDVPFGFGQMLLAHGAVHEHQPSYRRVSSRSQSARLMAIFPLLQ